MNNKNILIRMCYVRSNSIAHKKCFNRVNVMPCRAVCSCGDASYLRRTISSFDSCGSGDNGIDCIRSLSQVARNSVHNNLCSPFQFGRHRYYCCFSSSDAVTRYNLNWVVMRNANHIHPATRTVRSVSSDEKNGQNLGIGLSGAPQLLWTIVSYIKGIKQEHSLEQKKESVPADVGISGSETSSPSYIFWRLHDKGEEIGNGDLRTTTRTMEDIAVEFCKEYISLPPLRFPIASQNSNGSSASSSILDAIGRDNCNNNDKGLKYIGNNLYSCHRFEIIQNIFINECGGPEALCEEIFQWFLQHDSRSTITFLVSLREDLLRLMPYWKKVQSHHAQQQHYADLHCTENTIKIAKSLDKYLKKLLSTWFSPGMIEIRRITYEKTSASIIEKIALREAVHPMRNLDDLRSRLCQKSRRVYALFHPLVGNGDEPLVILHVFLKDNGSHASTHTVIPSSMSEILVEDSIKDKGGTNEIVAKRRGGTDAGIVATFYSISNLQSGLVGVGLGEFLIKGAVQLLNEEFSYDFDDHLTSSSQIIFVTLSPIPGFRIWLIEKMKQESTLSMGKMCDYTTKSTSDVWGQFVNLLLANSSPSSSVSSSMSELLQKHEKTLKPILLQYVAQYLILEKNKSDSPVDGVLRFHIGNGAYVDRINYNADLSRKGIERSLGLMVNYRYDLKRLRYNKSNQQRQRQPKESISRTDNSNVRNQRMIIPIPVSESVRTLL